LTKPNWETREDRKYPSDTAALSHNTVGVTIQVSKGNEEKAMQQNNAKIGGILSIVAGSLGVLSALMMIVMGVFMVFVMNGEMRYDSYYPMDNMVTLMMIIYIISGIIGFVVSALAITGGVFALKKKNWGLALAGSIAGVLAFFPCGVAAIIFTAMSKPEFNEAPAVSAV
jgi:hypothetical protein